MRHRAPLGAAPIGSMNTAYQPQKDSKTSKPVGMKEMNRRIAALVARERERRDCETRGR